MNKKILIGVVAVVVLLGIYSISAYNRFVSANEGIDGQWAQVESQYQRRFDLIPNLVGAVKGIFNQEKSVFDALATARTNYGNAQGVNAKAGAATEVESALSRLLVVVENYPELRSTETVTNLMSQLEGTENRISVERMRFNEQVRNYNTLAQRFPSSIIANMFGFAERNYFESAEGTEVAPKVEL